MEVFYAYIRQLAPEINGTSETKIFKQDEVFEGANRMENINYEEKNTVSKEETAKGIVEIEEEKCKGCEICVLVCPQGCIKLNQAVFNTRGFHPAEFIYQGKKGGCIACGLCYMVCPDYAITTIKKLKKRSAGNEV